jgi:hypothetical protein
MRGSCIPKSVDYLAVRQRTYLVSEEIDSEAKAHMNAEAAFNPPPHKRKTEDSQTSSRGNFFGKAPRMGVLDWVCGHNINNLHTNSENFTHACCNSEQRQGHDFATSIIIS